MLARPREFLSTFLLRAPPLDTGRERWYSFPNEAGKGTLISSFEVETGLILMLAGPSAFLSNEDGYIGEIFEVQQWCEDPLEVEEGRCDLPQDASAVRASSRLEGRTSWVFSSCGRFLPCYDGDLRNLLFGPQEKPVSM